jgi:hypothetical protein
MPINRLLKIASSSVVTKVSVERVTEFVGIDIGCIVLLDLPQSFIFRSWE